MGAIKEGLPVIIQFVLLTGSAIGLVSWLAAIIYAIKMVRRAQPGVGIWGRATLYNPYNLLLLPELLTDEGRVCRRKCFIAVLIFVSSIGLMFIISSATSIR